jgi:hypothetical protein
VLAHEIGHVILGESHHQPHGLMRPSFAADDLVELQPHSFRLSNREVAHLRQREHILDDLATTCGKVPRAIHSSKTLGCQTGYQPEPRRVATEDDANAASMSARTTDPAQ